MRKRDMTDILSWEFLCETRHYFYVKEGQQMFTYHKYGLT